MSWQTVFKDDVATKSTALINLEFQKVGISFYDKDHEPEHIFGIVYGVVPLIGANPNELLFLMVTTPEYPEGRKLAIRLSDIIAIDGTPA